LQEDLHNSLILSMLNKNQAHRFSSFQIGIIKTNSLKQRQQNEHNNMT
jgi:hypothetical protein